MDLIETIGSYAGFAAVIGLAILSALYFSQARDVKRLREWAGRAPERAAQAQEGGAPARAATPVAQQRQAAAGAQPAAGEQPAGGEQPAAGEQPGAPARDDAPAGKPAQAPAATAAPPAGARPAGANGAHQGGTLPPKRVLPSLPARGSASAAMPPAAAAPAWYRRVAPRYLALVAAGVVVLGAGGAYALGVLGSEDEPASQEAAGSASGGEPEAPPPPPVDPSQITVSVLNGTAVTGLARQVGDELEGRGYTIGNVTNATQSGGERAESAALYVRGARREARAVARALGISQIEAAEPEVAQLAGDASVIVVVGLDKTSG